MLPLILVVGILNMLGVYMLSVVIKSLCKAIKCLGEIIQMDMGDD